MLTQEWASQSIKRYERLRANRSTLDAHVQEVLEYCLPMNATVTTSGTPGEKRNQNIFDDTAPLALERFAAGMYNNMCPSNRPWFVLQPEQGDDYGLTRQLASDSELLRKHLVLSNFALSIHELLLDLGSVGTGCLEVGRGIGRLFAFSTRTFREYVISVDYTGRVDTVFRMATMTARQADQEFGTNCPESIVKALATDPEQNFDFLHIVQPRREIHQKSSRDTLSMEVMSVWIAIKDKQVVSESGWPQMRYLTPRFYRGSGEIYGRSPGMSVLPSIKLVNKIEQTLIVAAEKVVDPPWLVPDDGFIGQVATKPASLLYYRVFPEAPNIRPEPVQTNAQIGVGMEMAEQKRKVIREGFYNDLFMMLHDDKQRTATEVRDMLRNVIALLVPMYGRQKTELFDPMVEVITDIAAEAGVINWRPADVKFKVMYMSTMALALEYAELQALSDALLFTSPLAVINPDVWDLYSLDDVSRGIAEHMAIPNKWLRPVDEVRDMREARAQMQAQQAQQAQAMAAAEAVPNLSRAAEPGSPMERMGM